MPLSDWKKAEHFNADSESFYRNVQIILGYQKIRCKIVIFCFTLVLKQSVAVTNVPQFVWDQTDNESSSLQIEEIVLYSSAEKKKSNQDSKGEFSKLGVWGERKYYPVSQA